jgi:hypothetical protein
MYVCMYVCMYICTYRNDVIYRYEFASPYETGYGFMEFDDTVIILRCTRGIVVKASGLEGCDHEFDAWGGDGEGLEKTFFRQVAM